MCDPKLGWMVFRELIQLLPQKDIVFAFVCIDHHDLRVVLASTFVFREQDSCNKLISRRDTGPA